jgi:adenylate cyclase
MVDDERIRLLLPRILSFVLIGAALGAGYGYESSIADAAGLRGLIRGTLAGVLIGAASVSLTVFIFEAPCGRPDVAPTQSGKQPVRQSSHSTE